MNISRNTILGNISSDQKDKISSFTVTEDMFILGTIDKGLIIIKNIKNLVQQTNLVKDNVWHLTKNPQGFLVSSESENIELFDENFNLKNIFNTQTQGYKYAILNKDGLYFGTTAGLFLKNNEKTILISEQSISSLSSNKDYSIITAGTSDGKILVVSDKKIINIIDTNKSEPIFDIELESPDLIYIGGQGGFKKYENGFVQARL